jgi:hypothetical protein
MRFNINTDAAVGFSNTLEKLGKTALPNAVRGTLNKAVFDVKKSTLDKFAAKNFTKRQMNFFKANSRFENAKGSVVKNMKATIGMVSTNLQGKNNFAVKDLQQQEHGGNIGGKAFIPTVFARRGNALKGLVKPNLRISLIKEKIINAHKQKAKNPSQGFVQAAIEAGSGGFVLYNNMVFRIDLPPRSVIKSKRTIIKRTPIYSAKKGRKVKVKPRNFMKEASRETAKKMQAFYEEGAKRQLKKYLK